MTGRHSGVITRVPAVAPNATWVHCSIHREALAAHGFPDSLKDVLDTTVKIVNFVKAPELLCIFCIIATSGSVKIEFNQKPLPDFWIGLRSDYPALKNRTVKTLMPFVTTYLCESGFSALTSMK